MSVAFRERYYQGWDFDEELADNTMWCESTREPSVYNESSSTFSDLHYSENDIAIDSELDALTRRLEALETLSGPSHTSWHPNFNSPSLDFQYGPDSQQVNAMFMTILHRLLIAVGEIIPISHGTKVIAIKLRLHIFKNRTLIQFRVKFLIRVQFKHPPTHPDFMIRVGNLTP